MRVAIVTVGSEGDVRPYVALGRGLAHAGHAPVLVTHDRFRTLASAHGLPFRPLEGDPRSMLEGAMGDAWLRSPTPWGFSRRLAALMDPMLSKAMVQCADACRGSDLILFSILAWLVTHTVAEKQQVPAIAAYLQPATPTGDFPGLAFWLPNRFGRRVNLLTHRLSERVFWRMLRGSVNRARSDALSLRPLPSEPPFTAARRSGAPILYGFSHVVVPKPADWREADHLTGYWLLDDPTGAEAFEPPIELVDFLSAGPAPIYIGFGSIGARAAHQKTSAIVRALKVGGWRAVVATGWGGLRDLPRTQNVFPLESIPHRWLFPRVSAVVHHGGAGTTAAGLFAGKPTLTVPHSAEQRFWGARVHALGVGLPPLPASRLTARRLEEALRRLTRTASFRRAARSTADRLRQDTGVRTAVALIEALTADAPPSDHRSLH